MLNLKNISYFFWCINISIPPLVAQSHGCCPWTERVGYWSLADTSPQTFGLCGEKSASVNEADRLWCIGREPNSSLIRSFLFLSFVSNDLLRTSSRWITVSLQPHSLRGRRKLSESNSPFLSFFPNQTFTCSLPFLNSTGLHGVKGQTRPLIHSVRITGVSRKERVYPEVGSWVLPQILVWSEGVHTTCVKRRLSI